MAKLILKGVKKKTFTPEDRVKKIEKAKKETKRGITAKYKYS